MIFENIKLGMKLKLVRRQSSDYYSGLRIGDILTIDHLSRDDHYDFKEKNEGDEGFYVSKELAYCWEPVNQTLRGLIG
jgi:hypothetical protein